jgi:hypothetical protein
VTYDGDHKWLDGSPDLASRPQQDMACAVADDPFDRWLGHSLHENFGAVAAEPLPEELLRLINGAASGQRGH